jgi:hypothetical protein
VKQLSGNIYENVLFVPARSWYWVKRKGTAPLLGPFRTLDDAVAVSRRHEKYNDLRIRFTDEVTESAS